ncbi:peptidyl-tRNA hydrolase 2, mitochondrial [Selaginella moellendorffii]|uniref:peptidyl-tRNA hydrolase 2, mitochondrial n=1 Tax=Selaginella moellendorffii TaxID=88036 RepID=UPI000D1CED5C|nr:peptidyl-tRNA hydrolase 2, mitochondrial [Selaginella moellendorffii]|eukprot:XP_024544016.1 peptidyl-tRNA hydrolase 2, mitochondrial [Selaginella moellendorffii]
MKREEKPHWRSHKQPLQRSPRARQEIGASASASGRETWLTIALKISYFLPGLILGFTLGLWTELPKNAGKALFTPAAPRSGSKARRGNAAASGSSSSSGSSVINSDQTGELKMVFVVRMDLKMGGGKIASQCAHAAVGIYSDLMQRNDLKAKAERAGLPTFTIADAGRTQVAAGSKTVLVIGPGFTHFPSFDFA